jgi:predicted nucleic acid-binding protein
MIAPEAPLTGILDANGVIGLAKSGCFALIPRLFDLVLVPSAVVQEVTDLISRGELEQALGEWICQEEPSENSLRRIPPLKREADRHVLALALDHQPCILVTGDRALVNRARNLGIETVSAPIVVQLLAEAGLIAAARPYLDQMIGLGFGIPGSLYDAILEALGE